MPSPIRWGLKWFLFLIFGLTASLLLAQSTQSTLLGTVKDKTGAVIPDAEVLVTNIEQGVSSTYHTDAIGNYQALELPPGNYRLKVTRKGFETQSINGIELSARQQLRVDVTLAVGATHQEVTVSASFLGVIETESPSISASFDSQSLSSLPTNTYTGGTSPLNVLQALPGVQSDTPGVAVTTPGTPTPSMNFSVQGGQPFQTEVSVDGISTQNVRSNTPLSDAFPAQESIAEIRVEGVSNNAEFGQAGEITTITKSGSNQYHGSMFWHFANGAFDARSFGQIVKPKLIGNDFGVSIGGPATVPHLYNGHDKTFFFTTFEGYRLPQQTTMLELVPTQNMLNGDFSEEFPGIPLLNPATATPYPGNIPVNPSAQPFLSFFPTPNFPSVAAPYPTIAAAEASGATGYNYWANPASNYFSNQFNVRIDQHFSSKLQAFARYTFKNITVLEPQALKIAPITGFDNYRILASSVIYDFTPNLLNEFRFGFTDEDNGLRNILDGSTYTDAANFQSVAANLPIDGETVVDFPTGLTSLFAGNYQQTSQSHLFQYNDDLIWTKHNHTVKIGGDIRNLETITHLGNAETTNVEGFAFAGLYTSGLFCQAYGFSCSGDAFQFADFLAGAPYETEYFTLVPTDDGKSVYYAGFAQDQWEITPKLTLSFGLRYEYDPPMYDATGTIGNFDPSVASTGTVIYPAGYANKLDPIYLDQFDACGYGPASTPYAACTPVLSSSQAGLSSGLRKAQKDRFLPRVGLAWRPFNNDKTAVRAGFGIYNTTLLGHSFFDMTDTLQSASLTYTSLSPTYYPPAYMWPQTSPGTGISVQYGSASFTAGNQINWKIPYSMQWNLSIDHELPWDIGARVSYIGMKTDDLTWVGNENDMSYSSTTPALSRPLTDRPFPNWETVNDVLNGAVANYHSLQVQANHHMQHGLTFQSAYTWAKNLSDNQGTSYSSFVNEDGNYASYIHDPMLDYGNVYGARRHRWNTTGLYEIPVGRGRTFGGKMPRAADTLVGGWQLSSIFLWQTGPYLTAYIPGGDSDPSGTGSGALYSLNQRPDMVGTASNMIPTHRTRAQWLNPDAFACPSNTGYTATSFAGNSCGVGISSNPIGRFGNESVGNIEGPGTVNLSLGLNKRVAITERVHLLAEGTFTNVLNHTNLNDPNNDIESPDFGMINSARGSDFGGGRTGQVSMKLEF